MRTISWSLALLALVVGGSLAGCKSSSDGPKTDGGTDAGPDGGGVTAGFTVNPTTNLQTTEAGGQATFRVALATRPTSDVRVSLASSAVDEGEVSPAQLVFTADDWASERVITVTGKNDDEADGNQSYKIVFTPAESTDSAYAGKKPADVDITNIDNDTANLIVMGAEGLATGEPDTTDTFDVSLSTKPTANVTLSISSSDASEVTVTPVSVVFTPDDWSSRKTVTVRGVDDTEVDGPQTASIVLAKLVSDDARYAAVDPTDLSVVNSDNDTVNFIVRPTTGLFTHENGAQASFTMRLNTPPAMPVTVAVSVGEGDESEVSVSPATLTFTPDNWRSPHTVLITGKDDTAADGNQTFTIVTAPSVSADTRFNGVDPADVTGLNIDDDTPGVTVIADPNLEVAEAGGQATFYVLLNKQPTSDVSIGLTSMNTAKATVGPATLVFTADNWDSPHTVTVTGVNNSIKDGRQPVNIVLAAATSADTGYAGIDATDVTVFVIDDDGPGLTIAEAEDFTTNENGKQTTFTVRLNSRPTASVVIPLVSDDTGEIIISPPSLTFTVDDWNSPHTVTLTGVNDSLLDDDQEVDIRVGPTTSSDPDYLNIAQVTLTALNVDDDTPGVTVTPSLGLVTSESGADDTFTVVLNNPPTADVTFTLSVSEADEASVGPTTLTFTTANWNAPQPVTLTGIDDMVAVADGPQVYWVEFTPAVSTDPKYSGLIVPNVLATNNDNDTPGVTTTPVTNNMTTTELGGQATFNVALDSRPTDPVTLTLTSSRPTEGTASPPTLTFTPDNWNAPQLVTVTGVNDEVDDGPQVYAIQFTPDSDDPNYDTLVIANASLTNTDNDTAGITVVAADDPLITTEAPGNAVTFTIALNSEPTGTVTIPISTSRPGEATVNPTSVTFTPGPSGDWNSTKTVTVSGVGDLAQDGNQMYSVLFGTIVSTDAAYAAFTIPSLNGQNIDNDSASISVIGDNLVTDEGGGDDTFTIYLGAGPAADVIIPITISDPSEAQIATGGPATTINLTFTPGDFGSPRDITIEGLNDAVADGNQPYRITIGPAMSTDPNYAGRVVPSLNATNTDNDSAGITVTASEPLVTDEFGTSRTFTIKLTSQPTSDVTIPLAVSDTGEGSVSPSSLTFIAGIGPNNWDNPHTVTVTGVDDAIADGSQPYFVLIGPADSMDANYEERTVPNVSAVNTDNDSPGLVVTATEPLTTNEGGGTDTFTVRLTSQPTADVTVTIGSTRPAEGIPDGPTNATLTFTAAAPMMPNSWHDVQTVTIRGVNDDVDDRNQDYEITISSTSADPQYVITTEPNLDAVNNDNDTAAFALVGAGAVSVNEPSQSATFTLALVTQPTGTVTVPIALNAPGELTVSPASLEFTTANWAEPHEITVTAVNDDVDDGTVGRTVVFGPVTSTDTDYTDPLILPSPVAVSVFDDTDTASVNLSKTHVDTFEVGTTDTFTVVLTSQPTATATISVTSDDLTEATVSPASLEFTAANWNVPQTVTVTGVQDAPVDLLDGDESYNILLGAPVGPGEYAGMSRTVTGTNIQAFLHCREVLDIHPMATSGVYSLDTDRTGPLEQFLAYCDLDTEGGGWTLLSWTADSATLDGPPYPGLAYCNSGTFNCARGSGVPGVAEANALFANSTELGQGQAITTGSEKATFSDLEDYEYAGTFVYSSLAGLAAVHSSAACTSLVTGTYATISDASSMPMRNDGTVVYLNQGLRVSDTIGDYALDGNSYAWSIGNRTGYCATNGTPPASVVGTWQAAQYGPAFQNATGSYSIWVR